MELEAVKSKSITPTQRNIGRGIQDIELTKDKLFPIYIEHKEYLDFTLLQVNLKFANR